MADDDELAAQMPETKASKAPPIQEWSTVVEKLTQLIDAVRENTAVTARSRPPKPLPRPFTARDRIRARKRQKTHEYIVSLVQPREGKQSMADGNTDVLHSAQRTR